MPKPHNAYIGNTSPGWEWSTEPHWDDLIVSPAQGTGGAAGAGNKHVLVPIFSTTQAATLLESSLLLVYIKRSGSATADTYSGNMAMASLDLHIQRVKMGTLNEYPGST